MDGGEHRHHLYTTGALGLGALGLSRKPSGAARSPARYRSTSGRRCARRALEVIVNHIGTAPSDQRTVGAVRPGQTFSRPTPVCLDEATTWSHTVTNKTPSTVDVGC